MSHFVRTVVVGDKLKTHSTTHKETEREQQSITDIMDTVYSTKKYFQNLGSDYYRSPSASRQMVSNAAIASFLTPTRVHLSSQQLLTRVECVVGQITVRIYIYTYDGKRMGGREEPRCAK